MIIVLGKIQRLGLGGDPFAGIIFEFAALFRFCHHSTLDAQELIFIELCAVGAVGAGFRHFLSKQHGFYLASIYAPIIHQPPMECYCYFAFFARIRSKG